MVGDAETGAEHSDTRPDRRWRRRTAVVAVVLILGAASTLAVGAWRTTSTRLDRLESEYNGSKQSKIAAADMAARVSSAQSAALASVAQRVTTLEAEVLAGSPQTGQTATDMTDLQTRVANLERTVGRPELTLGVPASLPFGLQAQVAQLEAEVHSICVWAESQGLPLTLACP